MGRKFRTPEGKSQVKPGMGIILLCASEEHFYHSGEAREWTESPGCAWVMTLGDTPRLIPWRQQVENVALPPRGSKSWGMCVYNVYVSQRGVWFFFTSLENIVRCFFFFNPRDSNPICHPSFCHIPLPWTYNYGWHSPRGKKNDHCEYVLTKNDCFTLRWVICIVKTVITFLGGRKVLVAKYKILLGKKSHTSHF